MANMRTLRLPGHILSDPGTSRGASISRGAAERDTEALIDITTHKAVAVSGARAVAETVEIEVPDDCVVETEFEDGIVLWQHLDDVLKAPAGPNSRGLGDGDYDIPPTFGNIRQSRGPVGYAIKVLRFLGVDPIGYASDKMTWKLAEKIESKIKDDTPGLYVCRSPDDLGDRVDVSDISNDKPALILLHGTAS
ncbi:hypothetical protein [Hoeflea sp.]|uniref:hypothetical protein n=1 Tax=Hoeflea sp. TaxID=1940281 RepID=UPI003B013805